MITTERCILKPLTYEQVKKYIRLNNELEAELGLSDGKRTIHSKSVENMLNYTLKWIEEDPLNYLFATIWIIILKKENIIVGKLSFKGKPDQNGDIEIGYSTEPHMQNKGFMTEAIAALINWSFTHKEVKRVTAATGSENPPSIRVLEKNGFTKYKQDNKYIWWEIKKNFIK